MSEPNAPKGPVNPKVRANIYALAAFYLLYLLYQIAKPYLTHDPYGPTTLQFVLGLVVLGGGGVFLGFMAWKMHKSPVPEEPAEEDAALPEDVGEDGTAEEDREDAADEEDPL